MKGERLPLIGLVMIVKDGAETLPRCLDSVLPLIGAWTVCDTGSSDDTRAIVRDRLGHLPGQLYRHKWRDFGHNRTLALARAKDTARWLLMLDADEEVTFVNPGLKRWLGRQRKGPDVFGVTVEDHGTSYAVPYLTRGGLVWRYTYPTHEYLEGGERAVPLNGLIVTHHGERTPEQTTAKLERDIELLLPLFERQEPRAVFYTAECRRFLGQYEQAAMIYDLRASLNGWEEERWYSRYQAAACRHNPIELLNAWIERPHRHEPLTAAARIVAESGGGGDLLFLERPPS